MQRLLGGGPAHCAAVLPGVRRSASVLANVSRAVSRLPVEEAAHRGGTHGGELRRAAAIDPPGVQVRPASIARGAARSADAAARSGRAGRCRLRRAGASALAPAPAAGLQPGARSRLPAWGACPLRAAATREHAHPDRPSRGRSASQRPRRLRRDPAGRRLRPSPRAGGRCQHDRGDAGGVRTRADGSGGGRSADAYGSPSLDATACRTSALTSAFGRSPRSCTQRSFTACV